MMAKVEFHLRQANNAAFARHTPLPVTIRHASTRIAARGVTGSQLELSAGDYFASVTLADGSTLLEPVKVTDNSHVITLETAVPKPEESFAEVAERFKNTTGSVLTADDWAAEKADGELYANFLPVNDGFEQSAAYARNRRDVEISEAFIAEEPASDEAQLQASELIGGPTGQLEPTGARWEPQGRSSGLATVRVSGRNIANRYAWFTPVGNQAPFQSVAVAIPAAAHHNVEFTIGGVGSSSEIRVVPVLENAKANALLSYMTEQSFSSIEAYMSGDAAENFVGLLRAKKTDPIGAAVGGYGLLSINRFSPLKDWSENLTRVADWLPDGYAVHGETLARLGEHGKAAEFFLKMTRVGIPVFSAGLSFAELRLRSYRQSLEFSTEKQKLIDSWLTSVTENILPKLKLGETLTTIVDPVPVV